MTDRDLLLRELDAYRAKVHASLGGGIDLSDYQLVFVCRVCRVVADPVTHEHAIQGVRCEACESD